jgi:putative tricarboxylic transport membrane protein
VSERRIAGVLLTMLGALALSEARRLSALREEMVAGAVVGDDTFPWVVGVALVAMGLYALLVARWPATPVRFPEGAARRQMLGGAGALVAYYVVTPVLGYTLATLVVGAALFRIMGRFRWPTVFLISAVTTGALYLIFRVWMIQPLPTGWVGF